jgi:hypothetical protein
MQQSLAKRVDSLVELGWVPRTMTETSASLIGRRPFSWWVFLFVVVFVPIFGGILYLIFWLITSRAIVFLHVEDDEVLATGDLWLVSSQEMNREVLIQQQQQIKERGFLAVMWPQLLAFLVFLALWIAYMKWYS